MEPHIHKKRGWDCSSSHGNQSYERWDLLMHKNTHTKYIQLLKHFGLMPNITCPSFIQFAFVLCIFIQTHITSPSSYLTGAKMVHTNPQNSRAPQVLPGSFHSLQRGVFNASIRSLVLSVAELQCTGLDRTGKHPYCQWGWGPAAQRDKHTEEKRNKERRGGRAPEEEHNKGRTEEKKGRWGKMRRPYTGWNRSQVVFFFPSSSFIHPYSILHLLKSEGCSLFSQF